MKSTVKSKMDKVEYDTLSRMNWERRYFNDLGQNYTLSYEYNLMGGIKKITDPWNAYISYTQNKAGEATDITGAGYADINQWTNRTVSQFASNVKYRAWGAIKSFTNGNFAAEKTSFVLNYNSRLQMSRFDGGGRATDQTYYDDSRVKDITDSIYGNFNPRSYNYDHLGRLTSATAGTGSPRPYSLNYARDVWGNTTSRTGSHWSSTLTPYTPNYSNNRSVGSTGWTYDVAGNVVDTSGPNVVNPAMKYDATGRLASVLTASGIFPYLTEHGYDGDGQRVRYNADIQNSNPSVATTIHYLRSSVLGGAVIAEVCEKKSYPVGDPNRNTSKSNIYLDGERIAYQKNAHLSGGNKEVVWVYRNPVINTNYEHDRLNINGQPTDWWTEIVTDPTGAMVTTYDPGSLPQIPPPTFDLPYAGAINDFGDCYMDGVRSPCGIVMWMMERGWAAEAPWDDTASVWNPISGQYELARFTVDWDNGFYGFVPIGANYGGNGTWNWQGWGRDDDEADGMIQRLPQLPIRRSGLHLLPLTPPAPITTQVNDPCYGVTADKLNYDYQRKYGTGSKAVTETAREHIQRLHTLEANPSGAPRNLDLLDGKSVYITSPLVYGKQMMYHIMQVNKLTFNYGHQTV
ncbi:MAG: hypothetical protein L0287_19470, partial [Anaerolineae bacterium]|nr:hypothetical protein [Anaerolineae bacterium]